MPEPSSEGVRQEPRGQSPGEEHRRAHALGAHAAGRGTGAQRLALSLAVTGGLMVAEALGGWLSGSLALLSDAGHMLTDAGALALALFAIHFGARPADEKRTFGYRRAEVLAAQVNAGVLLALTGWIAYEAVERLRHPRGEIDLGLMAFVAALGLVGNGVVLMWLRGEGGVNVRSAFLHVLSDAVASLAVLGAAGLMWLSPELAWVDPVLSLAIAVLILWGAVRLMLEITDILMEAVPQHLELSRVCGIMEGADGVKAVHDLHIWTISSGLYALSAHLVVAGDAVGQNDEILTRVKARLRAECGIDHATLQIESADYAHLNDVHSH